MKILIAEDDLSTQEFLSKGLRAHGHTVDCVADGREALTHCLYNDFGLVIMDRMMPGMDGLAVLKALRAANNSIPVIFLTALADVDDRVEGLLAGADDYLVKPFAMSELLARMTVVLKRPKGTENPKTLQVHDMVLDLMARTVTRDGTVIPLHAKEFSMLELLMNNPGRVITKTMLLEQVWDLNFDPRTTVIETHISRLRAKVDKPFDTQLIHTIRNSGYVIQAPKNPLK